jgi:hypothetical protein
LMHELSCMSEMLASHMQEIGNKENVSQGNSQELEKQLEARVDENQVLQEKLREAEVAQAKRQMEMKALKQELQRARSTECLNAQVSKEASRCPSPSTVEVRQPSSITLRSQHSGVLKPVASMPTFCWSSSHPTCYRTWQKRNGRSATSPRLRAGVAQDSWRAAGLQRSFSSPRMTPYPQRTSSVTLKVEESTGAMHAVPFLVKGSPNSLQEKSTQSAPLSGSIPKRVRRSASVAVLCTAAPTEHPVVGSRMVRARSSSPLCSGASGEHGSVKLAVTASQAHLWSNRSAWTRSAPGSRSPSPVASLVAPPGVCCPGGSLAAPAASGSPSPALSRSPSPGRTSMVSRISSVSQLVKVRDSPPRRASPRGSLVHRSHWRVVKKEPAQES